MEIEVLAARPLTYDGWIEKGRALRNIGHLYQFTVGDWVNEGEEIAGDRREQAIDDLGFDARTVTNWASVSRKIPAERRRAALDFSAHAAVAYQPLERQAELLDKAEAEDLGATELRAIIKGEQADAQPTDGVGMGLIRLLHELEACLKDRRATTLDKLTQARVVRDALSEFIDAQP